MITTADAPSTSSSAGRYVTGGLLALAALLAAFGAWNWWQHEPAFVGSHSVSMPAEVGETIVFGLTSPLRPVEIDRTSVQFSEGSALATTEVLVCTDGDVSTGIGTMRLSDVGGYCSELRLADGVALDPAEPGPGRYLLLAVTPLEAGTVQIDGVEVSYQERWRTHTERVAPTIEVNAG